MQRINLSGTIVLVEDDDHILPDCNKIMVRYGETPPVACSQSKWFKAIVQPFPNVIQIHANFLARKPWFDKVTYPWCASCKTTPFENHLIFRPFAVLAIFV